MSDTDLTTVPIVVMGTAAGTLPANVDPLTQLASDINARFTAGKAARLADESALAGRITVLEGKAPVPGPQGAQGAQGPQGPQGPAGSAGANANLVAATLTTLGSIKANITIVQRTTTAIVVPVASISVLTAALLPSTSVTVAGVQLGDFVTASFAAAPPAGLTISAVQVIANNTVLVTFVATQALTLAAGSQSLNFCWMR